MTSPWVLTQTFDSEQGQIRWDVLGDGPAVVLLHGTPFWSFVWSDVAAGLARHFRVYVWDLAGYGTSDKYAGQDVSLAAQTRIFAALLEHWGLDRPHVVGHDFGGAVALRTLLLEAQAYARLVLADAVSVAPWGTGFFELASEHAEVLRRLPDPVHDGLVRGYATWATHHQPSAAYLDALAAPWAGSEGKAALYRQIVQNDQRWTDEIQPRYGDIEVPTLILWGEQDTWLPVDQGRELHQLIPGSRLHTIPGAGHLIQHDAPTQVTAEIIAFLMGPEADTSSG